MFLNLLLLEIYTYPNSGHHVTLNSQPYSSTSHAVISSFSGSMFLPPTSAFGAGLYSVAVYGGLVLFSMFLLYDTQKVIKRAETHPLYGVQKYDPINA